MTTTAEIRGAGPIFTTSAAVATDAVVYSFDSANVNGSNQTFYFEILGDFNTQDITDYSGAFYEYIVFGASNITMSQTSAADWEFFRDAATKINKTLVPNVPYRWSGIWADPDGLQNIDGSYGPEAVHSRIPFTPVFDMFLFSSTDTAQKPLAAKQREIQLYDTSTINEGKAIIDTLMEDTLDMIAGTGAGEAGYSAPTLTNYGSLDPDVTFGFTVLELYEKGGDVFLVIDGVQLQDVLDHIEWDGWTGDLLTADTFSTAGGVSTWMWNTTGLVIVVGPYEIKVQVKQ